MAYHDALFQLGMDLTRSSTAQKEDLGEAARSDRAIEPVKVARERLSSSTTSQDETRSSGTHVLIDVMGAKRLADARHLERTLKRCADAAGGTLRETHLHRVGAGGGLAGIAVMGDSHIAVRTWPDSGYVALDLFAPGVSKPEPALISVLQQAFEATDVVVRPLERGTGAAELPAKARPAKRVPRTPAMVRERKAA